MCLCSFFWPMQLYLSGGVSGVSLTSPGFLSHKLQKTWLSFNHSYFLLVFPLLPVQKLGFPHMYLIIKFSRLYLLFSGKIEVAEVLESYWLLQTLFLAPYYIPLIIWRFCVAPSVYRYQTNRPFITNWRSFRSRWMSCYTGPRLGEVWLQWLVKYGGVWPFTTPAPPWGCSFFMECLGKDNCGFKIPVLLHRK